MKVAHFLNVSHYTELQDTILHGSSIIPTSEISMAVMLVLLLVGDLKIQQ